MASLCNAPKSKTTHEKIPCVPVKFYAIVPSCTLSVTRLLVFNFPTNLKTKSSQLPPLKVMGRFLIVESTDAWKIRRLAVQNFSETLTIIYAFFMFYHMSQFTFDEFNFMWLSYEIASIRWTCDAVTKLSAYLYSTFKLIDQNPFFFSIHRFCLVVELYKQKGPACYDTFLGWISQNGTGLRNFTAFSLDTVFGHHSRWLETTVTFQQPWSNNGSLCLPKCHPRL